MSYHHIVIVVAAPNYVDKSPISSNPLGLSYKRRRDQIGRVRGHFVDDNVYNHIASETHASTLWEKIESLYASKCGNNKLFLLSSIVSLNFKEGTSLSDHLNEFQGILDQISGIDIKFEDEILGLLLLNSLLKS
ncbi:hypothetical protein CR513_56425, partial [Mucuna pruriens]